MSINRTLFFLSLHAQFNSTESFTTLLLTMDNLPSLPEGLECVDDQVDTCAIRTNHTLGKLFHHQDTHGNMHYEFQFEVKHTDDVERAAKWTAKEEVCRYLDAQGRFERDGTYPTAIHTDKLMRLGETRTVVVESRRQYRDHLSVKVTLAFPVESPLPTRQWHQTHMPATCVFRHLFLYVDGQQMYGQFNLNEDQRKSVMSVRQMTQSIIMAEDMGFEPYFRPQPWPNAVVAALPALKDSDSEAVYGR